MDYLVVITPYYFKPSADELFEHYSEVCRSVRIPVLAYNIPERTGVELTPAMLRRVAEANENFVGLEGLRAASSISFRSGSGPAWPSSWAATT